MEKYLANSENPDETAHKEPSHLIYMYHYLQTYILIYLMSEVTWLYPNVADSEHCINK